MTRQHLLLTAGAVGALGMVVSPTTVLAKGKKGKEDTQIRWDIVSVVPPDILPAGIASARANEGSKLTLTGSGTFVPDDEDEVTGGGTWQTFDASNHATGSGRYRVAALVQWHKAPGTLPPDFPLTDRIGNPSDFSAGLVKLRIAYSDGSEGVLTVGCSLLPFGDTPATVLEGITASKGFVDYWNREAPSLEPFVNANFPAFHISHKK